MANYVCTYVYPKWVVHNFIKLTKKKNNGIQIKTFFFADPRTLASLSLLIKRIVLKNLVLNEFIIAFRWVIISPCNQISFFLPLLLLFKVLVERKLFFYGIVSVATTTKNTTIKRNLGNECIRCFVFKVSLTIVAFKCEPKIDTINICAVKYQTEKKETITSIWNDLMTIRVLAV